MVVSVLQGLSLEFIQTTSRAKRGRLKEAMRACFSQFTLAGSRVRLMLLSYFLHHHASAEKERTAPEREVDIGMLGVDTISSPSTEGTHLQEIFPGCV